MRGWGRNLKAKEAKTMTNCLGELRGEVEYSETMVVEKKGRGLPVPAAPVTFLYK
jgi:hypothetical protein